MVWSMGLSGAGLHITVLAAFSPVLLLYCVCPFLQALHEVLNVRLSSAISVALSRTFIWSSVIKLLGLGFGPLMGNGLGLQISGPTLLVIIIWKKYIYKKGVTKLDL